MPARPKPSGNIKLENVFGPNDFKFSLTTAESEEELLARLKNETEDKRHGRRKDLLLFAMSSCGVVLVVSICAAIVVRATGTADDKKWAMSVLSSIVAGSVGFLFGKSARAEL